MRTTRTYGYIQKSSWIIELVAILIIFSAFMLAGYYLAKVQYRQAINNNPYDLRVMDKEWDEWTATQLEGKYYISNGFVLVEGNTLEEAFNQL